MKKISNKLALLVSGIVLFTASALHALTDGSYQIEVLCFENLETSKDKSEDWPAYVGSIDNKKAIKLNSDSPIVQNVMGSGRILSNDIKLIQQSSNHRYIFANGWTQALKDQVRSTPIYFVGGKQLPNHKWEVEGLISVKLIKNLFHTNIDLIFRKVESGNVKEFRLTQSARLKPKESYYFDHALLGAFVVVTPPNA